MRLKPGEVATGVSFFPSCLSTLHLSPPPPPHPLPPSLPPPFHHTIKTTIMAVEFDGGVVLGADSRTSTGTYVANRVSDKLTALHHHIYCCRSGSAADTQALSDYVRYFLASHSIDLGRAPAVFTAAKLMSTMIYRNKDNLMGEGREGGEAGREGGREGGRDMVVAYVCLRLCMFQSRESN